jgi:hypothetical protein
MARRKRGPTFGTTLVAGSGAAIVHGVSKPDALQTT